MAKSNPKPVVRASGHDPKAGRKKKYQSPPPINREKQDRKLLGEQQFHSKVNFTEEVPVIKLKDGKLYSEMKHVSIPYRYDPTRKRIVYNSFYNRGKIDGENPRRKPPKND